MRRLISIYLAVSLVGAVHAIRRRRPARFAGIRLPGSATAHALTIGTPLSAPPAMLIALAVAVRMQRNDVVKLLAVLFTIGIAGEADTITTLRHPIADPLSTACVGLELLLPLGMLAAAH